MDIQFGDGKTKFGPGVQIDLTGKELVLAIYAYLTAHDVHIDGPATIRVNEEKIEKVGIYVDPIGRVVVDGIGWSGRGPKE